MDVLRFCPRPRPNGHPFFMNGERDRPPPGPSPSGRGGICSFSSVLAFLFFARGRGKPWENAFWQDFDSKRMTRDEKKGIQESDRLTAQQKENGGAERIFGESAQVHEQAVHSVSEIVLR